MEIIKSEPTNRKKIQTYLMNTISLKGVLFIGVVFMGLVLFITLMSVMTPEKYMVVEKPLWNCKEPTNKFNSSICDGWDSFTTIKRQTDSGKNAYTYLSIGPFGILNRDVYLSLKLKNTFCEKKDHVDFEMNMLYSFETFPKLEYMSSVLYKKQKKDNIHVHCQKGEEYCDVHFEVYDDFTIETYERFDIYQITTTLTDLSPFETAEFVAVVETYNSKASVFEIMWRVMLSILNCAAIIVYLFILRSYYVKEWPVEIIITALLQYMLIFFNNPFCVIEMFTTSTFFYVADSFFESLFTAYLLFYIQTFFHSVRRPEKAKSWKSILARAIYSCLIAAATFGTMLTIRRSVNSSSQFVANPATITFTVLFGLSIAFYLFWLLFDLIRSCSERRKMDGKKKNRVVIFGIVTFGCILFILAVYITVNASGYILSNLFIALMSYVNLYCYFVIVLTVPTNDEKIDKEYSKISKLDIQLTVQEYDDNDEMIIEEENVEGVLNDDMELNVIVDE